MQALSDTENGRCLSYRNQSNSNVVAKKIPALLCIFSCNNIRFLNSNGHNLTTIGPNISIFNNHVSYAIDWLPPPPYLKVRVHKIPLIFFTKPEGILNVRF